MRARVQWIVDLPNPHNLDDGWVEVVICDRRRDAVNFVVQHIGLPAKAAKYFVSRVEM